ERFGADMVQGNVTAVDLCARPIVVRTAEAEYTTRTLIIATGASAKLLGLPAERQLMGHGVSTCATCDGYFFRGQDIAVVGGGDSAMEEAVFLTRFPDKVSLGHPRAATSRIIFTGRPVRRRVQVVWRRSTRNTISTTSPNIYRVRARERIRFALRPPMHPAGLRCSSLPYSRYARSSRLAGRAPRHPQFANLILSRALRTRPTPPRGSSRSATNP